MRYEPNPLPLNQPMPDQIAEYMEWIGEQIHERWAANRIREGWEYGCQYDGEKKKHPCLIPYDLLPESEKNMIAAPRLTQFSYYCMRVFRSFRYPVTNNRKERLFCITDYAEAVYENIGYENSFWLCKFR